MQRQSRIPEQQGIGQTLPPVPVGLETVNAAQLPPGAMPAGTRLQVGKYQVIVHNFIAEGKYEIKTLFFFKQSMLTSTYLRWLCTCLYCSY